MPVSQLYDAADSILAQKIAQVQGVGQVQRGGSAKPAVRIEANPPAGGIRAGAGGAAHGDQPGQRGQPTGYHYYATNSA
jgi:hypothetical protein